MEVQKAQALPPVEAVRARLRRLVARPHFDGDSPLEVILPDGPPPTPLASNPRSGLVWERFAVRSEPGPRGRVPVLLARPREEGSREPRRRPTVIVLHGTLSNKEAHAEDLARYALQGYVAVAIDSRYRGERGGAEEPYLRPDKVCGGHCTGASRRARPSTSWSTSRRKACRPVDKGERNLGDLLLDDLVRHSRRRLRRPHVAHRDYYGSLVRAWRENFAGREDDAPGDGDEHPFMYDTAWDLSRLLDVLVARPDVDPSRIGATGVSLGGMHVWFAAAADERIAAAAPAIGVQSYRYALEERLWGPRVDTIRPVFEAGAEDLESPGGEITAQIFESVCRRLCPGIFDELDAPSSLRCIAPRPLLVINGELDPRCPAEGVRLAVRSAGAEYERLGAPNGALRLHLVKGVAHEVTPAMWAEIDAFFAEHLRLEGPELAPVAAGCEAPERSSL